MSQTPEEFPETTADRLSKVISGLATCVGEALEGICSYGWTIGETYVPFDPDDEDGCEDPDEGCLSQAWVRVTSIAEGEGAATGFGGSRCANVLVLGLEVGVLRCIEVPEGGEAPTASDVLVAAMQALEDADKILCAALSCEIDGEDPTLTVGTWQPDGPLGGQYGGIWTFTLSL